MYCSVECQRLGARAPRRCGRTSTPLDCLADLTFARAQIGWRATIGCAGRGRRRVQTDLRLGRLCSQPLRLRLGRLCSQGYLPVQNSRRKCRLTAAARGLVVTFRPRS